MVKKIRVTSENFSKCVFVPHNVNLFILKG